MTPHRKREVPTMANSTAAPSRTKPKKPRKDYPLTPHRKGHEGRDMATLYRQRLGDERLEAVAKHVRKWLFGKRVSK